MFDLEQILPLFDREMRIEATPPVGFRREATPEVIRHIHESRPIGYILYAHFDYDQSDRVIDEQIQYFGDLGKRFEWKFYAHDFPANLRCQLRGHGLTAEEPEALMILDLETAPASLFEPVALDVRPVETTEQYAEILTIQETVWKDDYSWLTEELQGEKRLTPDLLHVFIAYDEGEPACAAWLRLHPGTHFASFWGGSTVEKHRRRGLYRALVAARAQIAQAYGARYLMVEASSMSRPILEKNGFEFLTYSYPHIWKPPEEV